MRSATGAADYRWNRHGGAGYGSQNDTSPPHLKAGHLTPLGTFLAKLNTTAETQGSASFTSGRVWKETPGRFGGTQAPHLRPMNWSRCCETVLAATTKLRGTVLS